MRKYGKKIAACLLALLLVLLSGCGSTGYVVRTEQAAIAANETAAWHFGFGREQIIPDPDSDEPLYIAGYNSAAEIEGVLDYSEARAVWIDNDGAGVLLIGIDCIALDSGVVAEIREGLSGLQNCAAIHVYATHTHAGADTLGLWGPTAVDGKNSAYMENLIEAAISAGQTAAADRKAGTLYYGYTETDADEMLRDSRYPTVCDANLYQLRFEAENGEPGLRMFFYTAHAESLRSINRKLSRDYPGLLCEIAEEFGVDELLVIGLANDELGYIVPPSDFLLNEDTPYLEKTMDYKGENHYEEINSVGPECALAVAEAFRAAMELLG